MKLEVPIITIFSEPIYNNIINKKFSLKEEKTIKSFQEDLVKNNGNFHSKNSYVLDDKNLKNLKKEILNHVQIYFDHVLFVPKDIKPRITQSWMNYTSKDDFHHVHHHPNSFVSGVYYVDVNQEDSITFYKEDKNIINIIRTNYLEWNCNEFTTKVNNGTILLFPSYLKHGVAKKSNNNNRISLAFNVFVNGNLGEPSFLTELKI